MVRIEGVGHHFGRYYWWYCIVVVVVIVADNANYSGKKLTKTKKNRGGACWLHPLFPFVSATRNLNSICAHDFVKVSLLEAYNVIHKFDIICLSETFLNSFLQNDDESLVLNGYKLVTGDNPSDLKRGGVCIYFKKSLPIKVLKVTNLRECLVCELSLNCRRSYIVSLYCSPSKSSDEYDHFINTFEQLISHLTSFKPHLLLITGDFNARSSSWWSGDVDNIEGTRLESITSFYGLYQIINELSHILLSSSSCIDFIFTFQSNMLTDSGMHPLLHQNWLHQTIFAKINTKIFYPPPCKHLIWDYRNGNVEAINSATQLGKFFWW